MENLKRLQTYTRDGRSLVETLRINKIIHSVGAAMAEPASLCTCSTPQLHFHVGEVRNRTAFPSRGGWRRKCWSQQLNGRNLPVQVSVQCCLSATEGSVGGGTNRAIAGAGLALLAVALTAGEAMAAEKVAPAPISGDLAIAVACVVEAIALVGAAVGGTLARQRKVELERINSQLRQINVSLRRQVRVESYAPGLKYAPVGAGAGAGVGRQDFQRTEISQREDLMQRLRAGKKWLREQKPEMAFAEFEQGLALARKLQDTVEEKKAARGMGASCQRQGKYVDAIKYHSIVLNISGTTGENSGDTEAYGAIADCYTELGDLETAAKYYDKYIERLEDDS